MNRKEQLPPGLRNPLDFETTNIVLQESILEAFKQKAPEEYGDHIIEFSDFEYPKKKTYSLAEQKKALLSRNDLSIPLKGTVTLRSRETGQPVDQKRTTLMRVPYLSNRGTYIRGGSEYSLAMQKRLRPGVYTRKTNQDEYETFIKTKGGSGFNIVMDPDTGQLSFKIYNSKTPMYSVMRGLGMSDDEIKETLGEELYNINKVNDYKKAIPKLWKKVTRGQAETDDIERDLAKQFHSMELDETTTRKTLGTPHKNVDNDVFKSSIKNLLATYRGERDVDDRDSLSYQQVLGPEDIFAEAILKDKARIAKQMLYKSQHSKNLDHVHANMYKTIPDYVFNSSRLSMSLEEVNPLDAIDANLKITGMGEGGFATEQGVPDTARMVTPTQLSYIDLVRSPECHDIEYTEVMTRTGWKHASEISMHDELATIVGGSLQFNKPSRIVCEPYVGTMYGVDSRFVGMLVTPNHRIWTRPQSQKVNSYSPEYRFETAEVALSKTSRLVETGCGLKYDGNQEFITKTIGDYEIDIVDWCSLLGWFISEGCCSISFREKGSWSYRTRISQTKKEGVVHISNLLNRLPFAWNYSEKNGEFCISSRDLCLYMSQFGKCSSKYIPEELFDAPVKAREALLESLMLGDGKHNGSDYYCTTSEHLRDDMIRLLFGLGYAASYKTWGDKREERYLDMHEICIHRNSERVVGGKYAYRNDDYRGIVWCATVPGGLMYVRYKGKCGHWSGNSGSVGVDGRLAIDTYKGIDGNLYSKFIDRNGEIKYVPSSDIDDLVIAFPGDIQRVLDGKQPKVRAVNKGIVDYVDHEEVDYSLPSGQQMFSQAANLIPYISGVKGMRALMGCLHPDSMITITRRDGVIKHTTIEDYYWEHGDLMVSMGADGTLSLEPVRAKVPNYTPHEMYNITLCSGKSLCTTANHKWITKGKDLGGPIVCVRADELSEGDLIPRYDGTQTNLSKDMVVWDTISSITEEPPQEVTYDLDLNDKTFVSNGVVVHNSKYTNQALSLPNREAPLVQSMDEQGRSFHERVADQVGVIRPDRPGKVLSVTPDEMVVQYDDGEKESIELYNDFLLNRKSAYSQTPLIEPGDSFKAGQPLTDSNYTRNGALALGTNLRVAYMDMKGMNHEDAAIISESAAKKLTSEHLYNEKLDLDKSISTDLGKFLSIFSGTYTKGQLDKLSEEGVVKPGTTVEEGDPLILNMQKRSSKGLGMIQGGKSSQWKNNTITWDHENPGVVTDTWKDDSGIKVAIKSNAPMQIGDKLCFADDHDLYTVNRGWQSVEDIHEGDTLLCLDLDTLELDVSEAAKANRYYHKDAMFIIENEFVSMKVTMNHKLVVSLDGVHFELVTAKEAMQYEVFWLLAGGEMLPVLISVEDDVVIDEHEGWVYCPTLKKHNTLLTRRDGKVHWSGNSGAYGNKGIVSKIVPDEEMPRDSQGRPFDYLVNPFGTIGRHNPSQIVEAQLGKVAEVTGKPYVLPGFSDEDAMEMVKRELEKNGLSDTETVSLPEGREVDGVQTGIGYYMKLHHMSEGKRSEVGEGAFNMTGSPTTELGGDKPKRIGHLEIEAMLAHGAPAVIRDAKLIRGQENRDYFKDLMEGKPPKMPKVSLPYRKFISTLQSSGVDVTPTDDSEALKLSAMTDSKVESLSSGEITSGDTVHWKSNYGKNVRGDADLDPVKGGLFDRGITGGMGGNRYSHITLPVKLPQPAFEKQLRTILGMTEKNLHEVLSGKESVGNYGSGPQAIEKALKDIDIEKQIEELSREYKESDKVTTKDRLAKQIRAFKGLRSQGINPEDLMTSKVLVLPPIFRPVSITSDFEIIADSNLLYKDLLDAKQNYQDMEGVVGDDLRNEALLGVYKAYKAVTGMGTPVKKERVDKKVKGLLSDVFGPSGNKTSIVQRNLTGTPTSYSARGVIIPDPNLTIDEIGLPWEQSWELFKPFVVRRMLKGTDKSPEAKKKVLEDIAERRPNANKALMDEMKDRPVIYSRAPVLHKYGMLGAYAKPVNGNAIRSNIPTLAGLGADFDGDANRCHIFIGLSSNFLLTLDTGEYTIQEYLIRKGIFPVKNHTLLKTKKDGIVALCDLADFPHNQDNLLRTINGQDGRIDVYSVPEGVEVPSYDTVNGGLVWKQVATWSKHYDRKVEIVTLSDKKQIITDDDPRAVLGIDVSSGLDVVTFTPSDAVRLSVLVPECTTKTNLSSDMLEVSNIDTYDYNVSTNVRKSGVPVDYEAKYKVQDKIPLTGSTGYFFGVMVGDGWTNSARGHDGKFKSGTGNRYNSIVLSNIEKDIADAWKQGAEDLMTPGTKLSMCFYDASGGAYGTSHRWSISSAALARLCVDTIGKHAEGKHLPRWFFNSSLDHRLGMLAGLLDTDGTISVSNAKTAPQLMIAYHSRSLTLISEIELLCQSLGIHSGITTYKGTNTGNQMWVITLNSMDVQNTDILDYLRHPFKKEILASFPTIKRTPAADRSDKIPITSELLFHIRSKVNSLGNLKDASLDIKKLKTTIASLATPKKFNGLITRSTAKRVISACSKNYILEHQDGSRWLSLVNDRDMTWHSVTGRETTEIREDLYDLCVPGFENFLGSNGIQRSNTFQAHAVATPDAVQEVKEKMLPSKNLFSVSDFNLMHTPGHGFAMGLYDLGGKKGRKGTLIDNRVFKNREELMAAYSRGEVDLEDNVMVENG